MMLQSGKSTIKPITNPDEKVIIMGNGPSLSATIAQYPDVLASHPLLAVNFAANAPEFFTLRPQYYVLADPYFFAVKENTAASSLMKHFEEINWEMTLFIPVKAKKTAISIKNNFINIQYFNAIGVEGFDWLENFAYSHGYGMPRPRNVLIPSIMITMALGYKNIYITGADHSWTQTLSVNERNEVVSIQPHFYKDDENEEARVKTEYLKYPLHQIIHSFYVAFKSYFTIRRYATYRKVNIYNATPDSFIDAFERRPLSKI